MIDIDNSARKASAPAAPNPMEGAGAYNRHARLQAAGVSLGLPLFSKAVEGIRLNGGDQPIVIADYGSSQGKNSLAPMGAAVKTLRKRVGRARPIVVYHVDLPSNDFTSLFQVADSDPDSYTLDEPNVFPCAIGRSFYRRVLPPGSVDLAWSSFAAHWLSRTPAYIPGHFAYFRSEGDVSAAFHRQAARDWEEFLTLRASELRAGGRFVVLQVACDDDGWSGFEELCDHANAALAEMAGDGLITIDERKKMVLGCQLRRKCDLLAPFQRDGRFQNLHVESCDVVGVPDPGWADYAQGRTESLAARQAVFFRTTLAPSLRTALTCEDNDEKYRTFADQLEERLKRRLAAHPAPLKCLVSMMLLVKEDSTSSAASHVAGFGDRVSASSTQSPIEKE
jgi:hypothetical protein